ncbi:MAG TPA: leucyl aminopeptidase [Jatrophihabitantaceae bacterium]|jgi:leucyl aminopeptidase|nr:leucyl aminopeptidase [Jatrophihabitantaceae bacterium]
MPKISLVASSAALTADAIVVGVVQGADGPRLAAGSAPVDKALGGTLNGALKAVGATGKPDEVTKIPTLGLAEFPLVVATGVGPSPDAEAFRRGVGAALRKLSGVRTVHMAIDGPPGALAEGAALGAYAFTEYKSAPDAIKLRTVTIGADGDRQAKQELKHAVAVTDAISFVRDLVNTPPNDLYPASFAARVEERAGRDGLQVEVLDERGLKRGKFGAILAVGSGSSRPPRLVRITHRPAKPVAKVALVGKGITFDSGGLNIKTANMGWMKSDMGGAAAVVGAVLACAALRLPVEVTATVPMAENMPSGAAYRPSDVITMRGGRTVEVADTDAEGRLVLADAIVRAAEDRPDYLIEASTLTGAQLIALGTRVIGAMGDETWRDQVAAAGNSVGEAVWAMPIPEELRPALDSPIADLTSLTGERWGGMLVGGAFLGDFVPDGLPWVHLDIAGPAFNQGEAWGYTPKGGTGAAVRTIVATVEALAG